ncbi:MAG: FAD-dependent oxidoreductase [Candidatus Eremiobacteraeota bacterium]|nr:FAD-dependent oxidoreductase [Candidatus Eremiobacteraeota bacterium]
MSDILKEFVDGVGSLLTGYRITLTEFLKDPVTLQYPWDKWPIPTRYRGKLTVKGFFDEETIERKSTCYPEKDLAPCMKTCPAFTDVRGYITAIAEKNYLEGIRILKNTYPFAGSLGRVCPAPCEGRCTRGTAQRDPLTIRYLKRFLADYERGLPAESRVPYEKKDGPKPHKVAVVGAGPAGLTCAWYLALKGFPVTVFEKLPVAGGYLATGIPKYRLPREILKEEIKSITDLGVELKLNTAVGKDISYDELFSSGYSAVFIGAGATKPSRMGCDGEESPCVQTGEDFLYRVNLNLPYKLGKRVVVIGGGNTAIDCARVAKRLGSDVTILYRRTMAEMPAEEHEINDCINEEVNLEILTAPVKVCGCDVLAGIECVRCTLGEPDASGRRKPMPLECSEFIVECDTIITAVSRTPELPGLPESVKLTKWGTIQTDPMTGATSMKGVYAGGDAALGAATVIEAIATAKKAAMGIEKLLS